MRNNWTRKELIIAFNLYCRIPFGKIDHRNPDIIKLALLLNRTPSAVSWKLSNFASLDPKLQLRNIKGASHGSKLDKIIWNEFNSNWTQLVEESELYILEIQSEKKSNLLETKNSTNFFGETRKSIVKIRVKQGFFRSSVLASYDFKCAITGINITKLLVASHIIPWSKDENNRLNPANGICLNSLHDKAFDEGIISLSENFEILVSEKLKINPNKFISDNFLDIEGKKMNLPSRFIPDIQFLKYHRENIFKL